MKTGSPSESRILTNLHRVPQAQLLFLISPTINSVVNRSINITEAIVDFETATIKAAVAPFTGSVPSKMVWKIKNKKNSKDNTKAMHSSLRSSGSGSTGTMISKSPGKSCLRKLGDSLDSDWSNSGSSVASSQRSDTFKCDQSSQGTPGSTPRSNNSNGSCENSSRTSSQASDSLDARISAAARAHNVSFPASAPLSAGVRSTGSSGSGSQKNRAVRFSVVEIRDYEREIADNPSCSCGPPIG